MSEPDSDSSLVFAVLASLAAWFLTSLGGLLTANFLWGLRTPNGDLLWEAFIFSALLGLAPVITFWTGWIMLQWFTDDT